MPAVLLNRRAGRAAALLKRYQAALAVLLNRHQAAPAVLLKRHQAAPAVLPNRRTAEAPSSRAGRYRRTAIPPRRIHAAFLRCPEG